jgi:alanine racemase
MNWLIVDAGADAQVEVGDEAVLMGAQGGEAVWADELARLDGTISYEILTGLSRQLERRWVD